MLAEVRRKSPSFAMIGLSGPGKSTVINRLFKTLLPVSHIRACTKEFNCSDIALTMKQRATLGEPVSLQVIDCPELDEALNLEDQYLELYRRHLRTVTGGQKDTAGRPSRKNYILRIFHPQQPK